MASHLKSSFIFLKHLIFNASTKTLWVMMAVLQCGSTKWGRKKKKRWYLYMSQCLKNKPRHNSKYFYMAKYVQYEWPTKIHILINCEKTFKCKRKKRQCPAGKWANNTNGQSTKEIQMTSKYTLKNFSLVIKGMQIQGRHFFNYRIGKNTKKLQRLIIFVREHAKK